MVKFALLSDFHYDALYDGETRLNKVLTDLESQSIDFILNLGDLCPPTDKYHHVMKKLRTLKHNMYYVLGNHDVEDTDKDTLLDFYSMPNDYYSFEYKHTKVIILNSNYMKVNGTYRIYNRSIFKSTEGGLYPVINPKQINWLKEELKTTCSNIIICSHHSLENSFSNRGVINREEVRILLEEARKEKSLVVCFNGHDHSESREVINNVHYFGMNSMSYIWLGDNVKPHKMLEKYYKDYPGLNMVLLYKDSIYSYVDVEENGTFHITGMKTSYLTDKPTDIGVPDKWNGRNLKPSIDSGKYNNEEHR